MSDFYLIRSAIVVVLTLRRTNYLLVVSVNSDWDLSHVLKFEESTVDYSECINTLYMLASNILSLFVVVFKSYIYEITYAIYL